MSLDFASACVIFKSLDYVYSAKNAFSNYFYDIFICTDYYCAIFEGFKWFNAIFIGFS